METVEVGYVLNGRRVAFRVREDESLLEVLRGRAGLLSVKDGCRPQGQCGACLAIVNGHPRVTCTLPAANVDGATIVTLEGLDDGERARLAAAFTRTGAVQCGACIPAVALHAHALVQKHAHPTRAETTRALEGHFCRCTGYKALFEAIDLYADSEAAGAVPEVLHDGGVGTSVAKLRAEEAALGLLPYTSDVVRPGMLHGALVFSRHARARLLSVDASAARALEGVMAVLTGADVRGEAWQGILLCDWPCLVRVGDEVRCVGDVVALVAAVDEHTARRAASLVEVRYEELSPVLSPDEALAEGAPQVNPVHPNLLSRTSISRGDADAALAACAHVVTETFTTQRIEHLFVGLECAVAEPTAEGGVRLWSQGQGVFDDRRQVASVLGIDERLVHVEQLASGGGFGGKEDLSVQAHAAMLAVATGRPVRVALDREGSVRMHPKRHPMTLRYTVGCDRSGHLAVVRAKIVGDSGAYASVGAKVLERAAGHACGPYRVPVVDVEALAVYTNNPPSGAMRGFGVNQAAFALEGCLDMLADRVGIDRLEMRLRNVVQRGERLGNGQLLDEPVAAEKTLLAVKRQYEQAKASGKAVGVACGLKNTGLGNAVRERARVALEVSGGKVRLVSCFTEMGQGHHTVLAQMAAEVTGLPLSTFETSTHTGHELDAGQTTASRGTLLGGRAVIDGARQLKALLDAGQTLSSLEGRVFIGETLVVDTTRATGAVADDRPHTAYAYATQLVVLDEHGHIERVVAAHDVGRAINPALCRGQIEGAVVMGLGYALTEELRCPGGVPDTVMLRELGALRARDIPDIEVILIESPDPSGPFGAKGIGEVGLVPTAPAVASALSARDGVYRTTLPLRDTTAALAMSVGPHHVHHRGAHGVGHAPAQHLAHHKPHHGGGEGAQ